MTSQTWLTVLGGLLSGLVGVGLFFLQRFKAGRDEQQNVLFRIYQIIAIPGHPEITRDWMARAMSHAAIFDDEQNEIHALALLLKDRDLGRKIYRFNLRSKEEREALLKELERRLNPRLLKLIDEEWAKAVIGTPEKTTP
jgi:hypothetical protein